MNTFALLLCMEAGYIKDRAACKRIGIDVGPEIDARKEFAETVEFMGAEWYFQVCTNTLKGYEPIYSEGFGVR